MRGDHPGVFVEFAGDGWEYQDVCLVSLGLC